MSGAARSIPGRCIASGPGSLVEIVERRARSAGGAVVVGNGILDVLSGGSANVAFQSTGSGGLKIANSNVDSSTFSGTVSGFGGTITQTTSSSSTSSRSPPIRP